MKRRQFLHLTGLAAIGVLFINSCKRSVYRLVSKMTGTNHILGHRLWAKDFPAPTEKETCNIAIIGGGISGLSAARALTKEGIEDFLLFELETDVGGNSSSGKNDHSAYPTGAHYVPAINLHQTELADFFEEEKIIVGYQDGKAVYHPEYVCHSPQERLYIDYQWIEGVEPNSSVSLEYKEQIERFHLQMEKYRYEKGADGRFAFDLPIAYSSEDEAYRSLDKLSMKEWMDEQQYTHPHLVWFLNYCCMDDFGQGIDRVSAWAGIHYFTSRKYNLYSLNQETLTWPEGNGFLVNRLKKYVEGKHRTNQLVYNVQINPDNVVVSVFDQKRNVSREIIAQKVIVATPQYINKYLFTERKLDDQKFQYAPWIIATISLERFPLSEGAQLSWENIIFQGKGLGYVYNQHQNLSQYESPFVITYYRAIDGENLKEKRKNLLNFTEENWKKEIMDDLKTAHPEIEQYILSMEIFRRGHGMISPSIDFLFSETKATAGKPIKDKVYFAHTDLSGISLFEEAFYQGTKAVKELLQNEKLLDL